MPFIIVPSSIQDPTFQRFLGFYPNNAIIVSRIWLLVTTISFLYTIKLSLFFQRSSVTGESDLEGGRIPAMLSMEDGIMAIGKGLETLFWAQNRSRNRRGLIAFGTTHFLLTKLEV